MTKPHTNDTNNTDTIDTDNTEEVEEDVTLFKSASNNSYYPVYFNALPEPGVSELECQELIIDLRPERNVTLYLEIYNPEATIPLIVTPGGMGEIDGFGGFARNVAAAAPDLKVIIWDRRNMGRSGINFGSDPLAVEEAEDLHVLIDRLGVGPAALYGMSSGARSTWFWQSATPTTLRHSSSHPSQAARSPQSSSPRSTT